MPGNCQLQLVFLLLPLDGRLRLRSRRRRRRCGLLGRHRLPRVEVGGAVAGFEGAHDDGRRVRQGVPVRGQLESSQLKFERNDGP